MPTPTLLQLLVDGFYHLPKSLGEAIAPHKDLAILWVDPVEQIKLHVMDIALPGILKDLVNRAVLPWFVKSLSPRFRALTSLFEEATLNCGARELSNDPIIGLIFFGIEKWYASPTLDPLHYRFCSQAAYYPWNAIFDALLYFVSSVLRVGQVRARIPRAV
jgi:hypothetical protein